MRDNMKSCQHVLTEDAIYKEVVVIGNGPSGMVTSFMLAGNVPYIKEIPDDLPIDDMLRTRLANLPQGQSLYETDLIELADGLEGRSQNPISLLMDNLLRPCADMGIQADSLIEWKFDIEKQISHIVLGRGPPGGSWNTFPPNVRTLSPAAWLTLPPHDGHGSARLSARAMANYCRRYVHACNIQKYFRYGVTVTSVTRLPQSDAPRCPNPQCPLNAQFCVSGYDNKCCRAFRVVCARVALCCGAGDRPNALAPPLAAHALHALAPLERAARAASCGRGPRECPPAALVVGSGVSAADAVRLCRAAGLRALHVHRAPADALARLSPHAYPDYCQVYQMMCDGPAGNHENYTSFPNHTIVEITNEAPSSLLSSDDIEDYALTLKRVKLLNLITNEITEHQVYVIGVFIGSKPDLFFLQTNYLDCIDIKVDCEKCIDKTKVAERKIEEKQCFLRNHWLYIKSMLGQSIQSCKSRYLNYTEINGNNDTKCEIPDCNLRKDKQDDLADTDRGCDINSKLQIIPFTDDEIKCQCDMNPYSSGIGFGVDPKKPVDGRNNPIAVDKGTHEILNAPPGMYAIGPLTADNFVRFIPGGALAAVAHMHKNKQ